jgi:HK97 family phage portal protein
MGDLGIYFNAYWLKIRHLDAQHRNAIGLVRIPPNEMQPTGGLLKTGFVWTAANGRVKEFAPSEIVHFDGYNPLNPLMGLSPLETLRNILAEEAAASSNRESFWRNAGRMEGIIERPPTAPKWTPVQKASWREQWQEFSAGGAKAGQVAVLEDGMTAKPWSFSAKDSEYTVGGKLRREVVAAAYHIPQPMVGILEHATFSNIKEQHKQLYQDSLGPWFRMIVQEFKRQILIESADQDRVYFEFNISAKMAGSFEEQANSLQVAVGRPWMTRNEARAKQNLPSDPDPESDRIAPQQGGPSDATAHPDGQGHPKKRLALPADDDGDGDTEARSVPAVIQATRARQMMRLQKLPAAERASCFFADLDRWNRELAADLTPIAGAAAAARLALEANVATLLALDGLEAAA